MAVEGLTGGLDKMYVMLTASGEGSCMNATSCAYTAYCGYHSHIAGTVPVIYANIPYGVALKDGDGQAGRIPGVIPPPRRTGQHQRRDVLSRQRIRCRPGFCDRLRKNLQRRSRVLCGRGFGDRQRQRVAAGDPVAGGSSLYDGHRRGHGGRRYISPERWLDDRRRGGQCGSSAICRGACFDQRYRNDWRRDE